MDIADCKQCLKGVVGNLVTIHCLVNGGTPPFVVNILIGEEKYSASHTRDGFAAFTYVNDSLHMKSVKCSVTNDALDTPLESALSRFYVISK